MAEYIHIICLDAPAPPDYGGAIDMYYKITALASIGKKIILHYFKYKEGRGVEGLEKFCVEVNAYPRKSARSSRMLSLPYIVGSRVNKSLIERLNKDRHPVLMEGIHCSGIIPFLNSRERVVIRMHNEESSYYRSLAHASLSQLKKRYYLWEANQLQNYQETLDKSIRLACLAKNDITVFKEKYRFKNASFIPCFIPWNEIRSRDGKGGYCLYHGNLAVGENEQAAIWLLEKGFSGSGIPFVIAGSGVSKRLAKKASAVPNCRLVTDPPMEDLKGLIQDAHIHVLPSLNSTGVKLKLLHVLFEGRFCITNQKGIEGSGIEKGVFLAEDGPSLKSRIEELWDQAFTEEDLVERTYIETLYNNEENARRLSALW